MTKLEIIELIFIVIVAISMAAYYLIKAFKNKWISALTATIRKAITEAETTYPEPGKGTEKKAFVISAVKSKCVELNIPYEYIWKLINSMIDKIIENYNLIKKGDK